MRAIVFDRPGGPDVLTPRSIHLSPPGAHAVLVEVRAAGVNFVDTLFRRGTLACPLPGRLGREGSGIVLAAGEHVTHWKTGDRVAWSMVDAKSYAERALVHEDMLVSVPDDVSDLTAAVALTGGITADVLAHEIADLRPGDSALVFAAAGSVGATLTSRLARKGVRVLAVVSGVHKAASARAVGADDVIVARAPAQNSVILDAVARFTGGRGVHAVFDSIGRDTWEASLTAAAVRGMVVTYGEASGAAPPIESTALASKSLRIARPSVTHYIADPTEYRTRASRAFQAVADSGLDIAVSTFPLAEAARAHAALESRSTCGKLVLVP